MTSETGAGSRRLVDRLKACPDDAWWQYILRKDPLYGKIPPASRREIIGGAVVCARQLYDRLAQTHGRRSAAGYAAELGVAVVTEDLSTDFDYTFISCYTGGPPLIRLSGPALDVLASLTERQDLPGLLPRGGLADLALGHELFHHIEEADPAVFTRQKTIEYRLFGLFSCRACAVSASEIAAVHFSRLVAGLDHSPAIYEILLLYLQKPALAEKIIGDLLAAG